MNYQTISMVIKENCTDMTENRLQIVKIQLLTRQLSFNEYFRLTLIKSNDIRLMVSLELLLYVIYKLFIREAKNYKATDSLYFNVLKMYYT